VRKSLTFKREKPGVTPAWLAYLRDSNEAAREAGKPEPFGGTPVLGDGTEDYAAGGRVVFTGVTGRGTVTLSWDEPGQAEARSVVETDAWGHTRVVGGFGDVGGGA
jgi:hypothetical protein